MIKLKSGNEIEYDADFERFFQKLLSGIITESYNVVQTGAPRVEQTEFNRLLAKEIMDNAIFVSHQIFELSQINQNLAKFLVTGFLFNSIILSLPNSIDSLQAPPPAPDGGKGTLH